MKILHSRYVSVTLLLLLLAGPSGFAQNDLRWADRLEAARKLYYGGSYYAAEKAFDALSSSLDGRQYLRQSEIDAYKVLCAIALDRANIDGQVKVFSDKHPNAPELSMINCALASNYFDRGMYAESAAILRTINAKYIYKDMRPEFCFKRAFAEMTLGNRKPAAEYFAKVVGDRRNSYTYPATYYLGYVNYLDRNFNEAFAFFCKSAEDSRFEVMSRYYALECKFMASDHSYVAEHGDAVYDAVGTDLKPNVARMLSESYFSIGETTLAQHYMDIFESSGMTMSRKDNYFSALLAYNLNSFGRAISYFDKVTEMDGDSLSQSAHYFKAHCQLQTGNKLAALKSFRNAADYSFDPIVQEDAMFNYAKLSFDVNSNITPFDRYLAAYPKSGRADVISNYMAMSFVENRDYATAVDILSRIAKPSPEVSGNLQKASFLRALQLIESGSYRAAVPMLELSVASGRRNESLSNLARYWDAECLFRDGKYVEAINVNKSLLSNAAFRRSAEYPMALFNQGYCYFKNGNYVAAQKSFEDYLSCSDAVYEKDASIRLADSYFMQSLYKQAASAYSSVCDRYPGSDDIYPALQAAVSYGLSGDNARKLAILKNAVDNHRNTPLYSRALYELGSAYFQDDLYVEASECFLTLQGKNEGNPYFAKSLLALAMINSNSLKYSKAIEYYKRVVKEAPDSQEAQDALAGMENIYNVLNRPAEYLTYLDENGLHAVKSDEEREAMLFASAEQLFRSGDYSSAMVPLQTFIATYPGGDNAYKARYYMAETLRLTGRKEAACDMYDKVINAGGIYTAPARAQYAQLSYELERYDRAARTFADIAASSTMDDVRCSAFSGLMRSRYALRDYVAAAAAADSVLAYSYSASDVLREAKYYKAKSLVPQGLRDKALAIYGELVSDRNDAFGAEASYELVLDAYNSARFDEAEQLVYAFSESGSQQMYWLARSFIVLGDVFAAKGDREQAEATFRSVAEGYPADAEDGVVPTAQKRLASLKGQEAIL